MAKIVVQNEKDPQIAIVLTERVGLGDLHGSCTECGWPLHRWNADRAIAAARAHVDGHDPVIIGGDADSLVR